MSTSHLSLPNLSLPNLSLPDLSLPDLSLPDLSLPDLSLPDLSLPDPSLSVFPVTWRHHDDAERFWTQDRLHYPDPLTPLEFSLVENGVDAGISKAAAVYDIPIRLHDRHINSYLYISVEPLVLSAEEEAQLAQQSQIKLLTAMANLRQLWETDWLPEIQSHLAAWQAFPLASASLTELLTELDTSEKRFQRVWEIHFLLFLPSMLAISQFADRYAEVVVDAEPLAAYRLLAGFDSKTLQSAHQLWAISRQILACPEVLSLFRSQPAASVIPALCDCAAAQPVLQALQHYLAEHGQRADKLSLHYPFWVEDPTPVIHSLQNYIAQPERDLMAEHCQAQATRRAATEHLQTHLEFYPPQVDDELTFLLHAAQAGAFLKEEHGYWIDYKASYCMRQLLLTIGQRLVALQILPTVDDLFYLNMDEVRRLLRLCISEVLDEVIDYRALIEARKIHAERYANFTPPASLGTPPAGATSDDPISRMFLKIEGEPPANTSECLQASETGEVLFGNAGSPGIVQGIVRVLHVLGDAVKLQPGDILVAASTAPPWSPLFASVRGLVTDSGGILSHSAVVAREYGIPAVVGAGTATQRLQDGQAIEVDGSRGIVRIL